MTRTGCPASLAACGSSRAARIWCDAGAHAGQAHAGLEGYLPAAACEILVRTVRQNRPEGGQGGAPAASPGIRP